MKGYAGIWERLQMLQLLSSAVIGNMQNVLLAFCIR